MAMPYALIVPWHSEGQLKKFKEAWKIPNANPEWIVFQQDKNKAGCAATKNAGIRFAIDKLRAEIIMILDDDCFPAQPEDDEFFEDTWVDSKGYLTLNGFVQSHLQSLQESEVEVFQPLTFPVSRGTPHQLYPNQSQYNVLMPVAASMGFWKEDGDVDAVTKLAVGSDLEVKLRSAIYGRYFPLCGMNLAFRSSWWPWCRFINVPRFDDIWMGWLWQKRAYAMGYCFNLQGPTITHKQQSSVWDNLVIESPNMKYNQELWSKVALAETIEYEELIQLLPYIGV